MQASKRSGIPLAMIGFALVIVADAAIKTMAAEFSALAVIAGTLREPLAQSTD